MSASLALQDATDARCEPPPELRGKDGWHWVTLEGSKRQFTAFWRSQYWWDGLNKTRADSAYARSWRYLSPALTPAEVAALRAERDAAVEARDIYTAAVKLADNEITTLRGEVENLRAALKPFADAAPKFRDCGDAIEVADIAHDATFTVGDLRRAATLANAVEVPE